MTDTNGRDTLQPNSIIQDSYRVLKKLGSGAMGETWAGENIALGHDVAIKVIHANQARDPQILSLFRRGSRLLRNVRDDAVAGLETTLQDQQGRLFLVTEYVSGPSLSHFVSRGARLGFEDLCVLGERLAGGLAAIHGAGIVHRDIAPDNIVCPDGDVWGAKIIDFDLASDSAGTEESILAGNFAGKYGYAAPEQFGLFDGAVGEKADIYALGTVLLRLAGIKVIDANSPLAQIMAIKSEDIDPARYGTDEETAALLRPLLRANPAERLGPASEAAAHFTRARQANAHRPSERQPSPHIQAEQTAPLHPERHRDPDPIAPPSPPAAPSSPNTKLIALTGIALIAALGLVWVVFILLKEDTHTVDQAASEQSSGALSQAALCREQLESGAPLIAAQRLLDQGGVNAVNAAMACFIAISRDETLQDSVRSDAFIALAQMQDPATFEAARSPFQEPNAAAALRAYREAARLGATEVLPEIVRLGGE